MLFPVFVSAQELPEVSEYAEYVTADTQIQLAIDFGPVLEVVKAELYRQLFTAQGFMIAAFFVWYVWDALRQLFSVEYRRRRCRCRCGCRYNHGPYRSPNYPRRRSDRRRDRESEKQRKKREEEAAFLRGDFLSDPDFVGETDPEALAYAMRTHEVRSSASVPKVSRRQKRENRHRMEMEELKTFGSYGYNSGKGGHFEDFPW